MTMTQRLKPLAAIKILRGLEALTFGLMAWCIIMAGTTAGGQTIDPSAIKSAAQTVAGLNTAELLALVALGCLLLAFYLIWSVQREIKNLTANLMQRPCIRDPKND